MIDQMNMLTMVTILTMTATGLDLSMTYDNGLNMTLTITGEMVTGNGTMYYTEEKWMEYENNTTMNWKNKTWETMNKTKKNYR